MSSKSLITAAQAKSLLSSLQYVLLDIDGVLWSGDKIIEGSPQAVSYFRSQGRQVRFLSNNASISRQQLVERLLSRGIAGVTLKEVYNSAYAASLRLLQVLGSEDECGDRKVHGNVLVIGEEGLQEELQAVLAPGFVSYGVEMHGAPYEMSKVSQAWREAILPPSKKRVVVCNGAMCRMIEPGSAHLSLMDLNPLAVVVGLDLHFNLFKLAVAAMALQGPPAELRVATDGHAATRSAAMFVATNEDPQIPVGHDNVLLPGAGTMVSALATAAGRRPDVVCGKPFTPMAEALMEAEHITNPKETCLMIGDRLTTDVAFGNNAGMSSMLVLSGAETMADVEAAVKAGNTPLIPDYVGNCLGDFLPK